MTAKSLNKQSKLLFVFNSSTKKIKLKITGIKKGAFAPFLIS